MSGQKNIIKTRSHLPEEIQALLDNEHTVESIETIGGKFGLSVMDTGFLTKICGKLLTGTIPPNQFIKAITDSTDIENEKAVALAVELNKELFSKVKEALEVVHGLRKPAPKAPIISPYPPNPSGVPPEKASEAHPLPPPPAPKPSGSILEQKLGGAFRLKDEESSYGKSAHPLSPPREVVPPPPAPTGGARVDPYRELPQ